MPFSLPDAASVLDLSIGVGWVTLLALNVIQLSSHERYALVSENSFPNEFISVIVPARNEEKRINACLRSALRQSHTNLEIIVVDDRSTDNTGAVVRELQREDLRISLIEGQELPANWAGKNWACFQGFQKAKADWFLFIDSDTTLQEKAVEAALAYAKTKQLQALSLIPKVEYDGFWPRVVGPVLSWMISFLYPLRRINDPRSHTGLVVGGFVLISREAYLKIGGHDAVRDQLVEDKQIGDNLKAANVPYMLLIGRDFASVGLFTGGQGAWNSVKRVGTNPLRTHRLAKVIFILLTLLFFLYPPLLLIFRALTGVASVADSIFALVAILVPGAIVVSGMSGAKHTAYLYALLAPVGGVFIMLALLRQMAGGSAVGWRGRNYEPAAEGRSGGDTSAR